MRDVEDAVPYKCFYEILSHFGINFILFVNDTYDYYTLQKRTSKYDNRGERNKLKEVILWHVLHYQEIFIMEEVHWMN